MSISPYLSRIMVARNSQDAPRYSLEVDDLSTGLCLAMTTTNCEISPAFTQRGRQVWTGYSLLSGREEQNKIIEESKSGAIRLMLKRSSRPQGRVYRDTSGGYTVTGGCWVLSPGQKRLLWLPHRWRSHEENRAWDGRFLVLLHDGISGVVVLKFLE